MLVLVLILVVIALVLLLAGWFLHLVVLAWTSVAISVVAGVVLFYDWWQTRSAVRAGRQGRAPRDAEDDRGQTVSVGSGTPGRAGLAAGAVGAAGAGTAAGAMSDGFGGADMEPATQVLPVIRPDVSPSEETTRIPVVAPSGSDVPPSGASRSSGLSSPSVTDQPGSPGDRRHPDVDEVGDQAASGTAVDGPPEVDHSASRPMGDGIDPTGRTDGADGVPGNGRGGDRVAADDPVRAGRVTGAEPAGAGQLRAPHDAPVGRDADASADGAGTAGAAGAGAAAAGAGAAVFGAAAVRGTSDAPETDRPGAGSEAAPTDVDPTGRPVDRPGEPEIGRGGPGDGSPVTTAVPPAGSGPVADGPTTTTGAAGVDAGQSAGERTTFLTAREPGRPADGAAADAARQTPMDAARQAPMDAEPTGEAPEEPRDAAVAAAVSRLPDEVVVIDERPRYHLQGCRTLPGQPVIPLPVSEAVELGFTPCGWCTPNRALAERHPAEVR